MKRRLCVSWFLRIVLVAALCIAGSPYAAEPMTHDAGSCAGDARDDDDASCPPTCPNACASPVPAVVENSCECGTLGLPRERCVCDEAGPPLAPPLDGVFRPPTR